MPVFLDAFDFHLDGYLEDEMMMTLKMKAHFYRMELNKYSAVTCFMSLEMCNQQD